MALLGGRLHPGRVGCRGLGTLGPPQGQRLSLSPARPRHPPPPTQQVCGQAWQPQGSWGPRGHREVSLL